MTQDKGPIAVSFEVAKRVADANRRDVEAILKHFGNRPWAETTLSEVEQLAAFSLVRENPEFWTKALRMAGKAYGISDGQIAREPVEDAIKMEARYQQAVADGTPPIGYHWMSGILMLDAEMDGVI